MKNVDIVSNFNTIAESVMYSWTMNLRKMLSAVTNVVKICDRSKIRDFVGHLGVRRCFRRCSIVVQRFFDNKFCNVSKCSNNGNPTAEKLAMHKHARNFEGK